MHLGSLVKLQGGGVVLKFCTIMQVFCAVCMQAVTHSVDFAPSRQAVKLVVEGPCFVSSVALDCFWETSCNEKWGELGTWLCNP